MVSCTNAITCDIPVKAADKRSTSRSRRNKVKCAYTQQTTVIVKVSILSFYLDGLKMKKTVSDCTEFLDKITEKIFIIIVPKTSVYSLLLAGCECHFSSCHIVSWVPLMGMYDFTCSVHDWFKTTLGYAASLSQLFQLWDPMIEVHLSARSTICVGIVL